MENSPEATIVVPLTSEDGQVGSIELKAIGKDQYSATVSLEFPIKKDGKEVGKIKISTDNEGKIESSANFKCPVVHNGQEMGTVELIVEKRTMSVKCEINPEKLMPKGGISKPKLF